MFFDPPVPGDAAFYRDFYEAIDAHDKLTGPRTVRREFQMAAARILPGDKVLDIGCGLGGFRSYVPQAEYTGLDPNFGAADGTGPVIADTLAVHAGRRRGHYDVACAFQVIEHVPDPLGFARQAAACLRPGGRLVLGVPFWPSPSTTIPNFTINAPPHHLTWWTEGALLALARRIGLEQAVVTPVPVSRHESTIYWMSRATPIRCRRDLFFAARRSWYAALAIGYGAGRLLDALLPVPRDAGPNALLLVAQRPA